MNTIDLIRYQLIELNIKNNIIDLLTSLLPNDIINIHRIELKSRDKIQVLDDLIYYATTTDELNISCIDEIIKLFNYYIKISNPTQTCYLTINEIIDNLKCNSSRNGVEFELSDFDNNYMILLYYITLILTLNIN